MVDKIKDKLQKKSSWGVTPVNHLPEERKEEIRQIIKGKMKTARRAPSTTELEQMLVENQLALCELVELVMGGESL